MTMLDFRASPIRLAGLALAALTLPGRVTAQTGNGGQVELGVYGLYTRFDPTGVGLGSQGGIGSRLGLFLNRLISVEANGDYTPSALTLAGKATNVARVGGALLLNLRLGGQHAVYLGGGYEQTFYRDALTGDQSGIN